MKIKKIISENVTEQVVTNKKFMLEEDVLSNREKLLRAFPELDFSTKPVEEDVEPEGTDTVQTEEKLEEDKETFIRDKVNSYLEGHSYPTDMDVEDICEEICDNLFDVDYYTADPELSYAVFCAVENYLDNLDTDDGWDEYDDDYYSDDDVVEQDRMHAALYGGDREYCSECGSKLVMDEWGGLCPKCDADQIEENRIDQLYHDYSEDELKSMGAFDNLHDDIVDESFDEDGNREYCDKCNTALNDQGTCPKCDDGEEDLTESALEQDAEYIAKETSYEIAHQIALMAYRALHLQEHEVEMLEHDINNLRANEWVDEFSKLSDRSKVKKMFFTHCVKLDEE